MARTVLGGDSLGGKGQDLPHAVSEGGTGICREDTGNLLSVPSEHTASSQEFSLEFVFFD